MKKLLIAVLFFSFTVLNLVPTARSQSIQEIIEQSGDDTSSSMAASSARDEDTSENGAFYAIQTGTFFNETDAENHLIQLKNKGMEPYVFQSVNSKGDTVYAVRMGRFESYTSAGQEVDRMQSTVDTPLIITHFDSLKPAGEASSDTALLSAAEPKRPSVDTEPDSPMDALATSPMDATFAETDVPLSLEGLQEKMQAMEMEIQKLRDEADVRSQLEITEEEAEAEEEDILEAAGREYTLTREGNIKLTYGISYGYSGYDAIREGMQVEDVADHTISNSFNVSYGLKDNFTVGTSIPFVYKYHRVGSDDSLDVTDFGDLSLSWQLQPFKATHNLPTIIFNGNFGIPVGRNPYEIQVGEELSTASGIYDANFGVSVSQVTDPIVAFGSLSVSYPFAVQSIEQKRAEGILDEVDPGMSIGASVGLGYALSYKLNLNLSFSYSYGFGTTYKYANAPDMEYGNSTSASFRIGTGYKISRNQNLNFSIGIPITDSRSFSFSLSTPIDYEL